MPITSLTSYFNTSSFGDTNTYTRNQQELALTLDSAAHELANWKSLIAMSAGGGAFEGGRLLATTFFSSVPVLSAIPLLTKAVTFFAGALADTSLTRLIHQAFGNVGEEESFSEQITSQGSVRLLGVLGAGQCFVVIQLLQGLASVSRGMVCGESSQNQQGSFLHHLLMGLQCHFGSGMFAGLTGGVVAAVEQRMSIRTLNMNVGAFTDKSWRASLRNFGKNFSEDFEKLSASWNPQASTVGSREIGATPEPMRNAATRGGRGAESATERRKRLQSEITGVNTEIGKELIRYRSTILRVRRLMALPDGGLDPEIINIHDQLQLRETELTRKFLMGEVTVLIPEDKYPLWSSSRFEAVLYSLKRSLREAQRFYSALELPLLPSVATAERAKTLTVLKRMLRKSGLSPELIEAIERMISGASTRNSFISEALEGLIGLLSSAPVTLGRRNIVFLLERFCSLASDAQTDPASFTILLVIANHFHIGLLSRAEAMGIISRVARFYRAHKERAIGSFIDLFFQAATSARSARSAQLLIDFAERRLRLRGRVILEPCHTLGQATFLVETASRKSFRYVCAGISRELENRRAFTKVGYRLIEELLKVGEREFYDFPNRIYIEVTLNRQISETELCFWGKQLLEEGRAEAVAQLSESYAKEKWLDLPPAKRTREELHRCERLMKAYWEGMLCSLDEVEIVFTRRGEEPRRLLIRAGDPSTTSMLGELYGKVQALKSMGGKTSSADFYSNTLLLAQLLMDSRRNAAAFKLLKAEAPFHERAKERYREIYLKALDRAFLRVNDDERGASVYAPPIRTLLADVFGRSFTGDELKDLFSMAHPDFDLSEVRAVREGESLLLKMAIVPVATVGEAVGEFVVRVFLDPEEGKFVAQGKNIEIYKRSQQGKGIGVLAMARVFNFLKEISVLSLFANAEGSEIYPWLRMGAQFVRKQDRMDLADFLTQNRILATSSLEDISTEEILETLSRLGPKRRIEVLNNFRTQKPFVSLSFKLDEASADMRRFRAYYYRKLGES